MARRVHLNVLVTRPARNFVRRVLLAPKKALAVRFRLPFDFS
jgi:hypothetical protein